MKKFVDIKNTQKKQEKPKNACDSFIVELENDENKCYQFAKNISGFNDDLLSIMTFTENKTQKEKEAAGCKYAIKDIIKHQKNEEYCRSHKRTKFDNIKDDDEDFVVGGKKSRKSRKVVKRKTRRVKKSRRKTRKTRKVKKAKKVVKRKTRKTRKSKKTRGQKRGGGLFNSFNSRQKRANKIFADQKARMEKDKNYLDNLLNSGKYSLVEDLADLENNHKHGDTYVEFINAVEGEPSIKELGTLEDIRQSDKEENRGGDIIIRKKLKFSGEDNLLDKNLYLQKYNDEYYPVSTDLKGKILKINTTGGYSGNRKRKTRKVKKAKKVVKRKTRKTRRVKRG